MGESGSRRLNALDHGGCRHHHPRLKAGGERKLAWAIALTTAFVLVEGAAGYLSKSLALLSDAVHNLSDALALLFSWYAVHAARRPSNSRRTYGYHRIGILAALANAVTLVVLAVWIAWEAVERLKSPAPPVGVTMIVVAAAAIFINGLISYWLHSDARHDLNIRGAYLHMLGDALTAFAVVVAGLIVVFTRSTFADPIVSVIIAIVILWSSWGLLVDSTDVLLESTPKGLDMTGLERSLAEFPEVVGVHDLHVWTIASEMIACSCHLVVDDQKVSGGQRIQRAVAEMLRDRFGICHATLQIETDSCESDSIFCKMRKTPSQTDPHTHLS